MFCHSNKSFEAAFCLLCPFYRLILSSVEMTCKALFQYNPMKVLSLLKLELIKLRPPSIVLSEMKIIHKSQTYWLFLLKNNLYCNSMKFMRASLGILK